LELDGRTIRDAINVKRAVFADLGERLERPNSMLLVPMRRPGAWSAARGFGSETSSGDPGFDDGVDGHGALRGRFGPPPARKGGVGGIVKNFSAHSTANAKVSFCRRTTRGPGGVTKRLQHLALLLAKDRDLGQRRVAGAESPPSLWSGWADVGRRRTAPIVPADGGHDEPLRASRSFLPRADVPQKMGSGVAFLAFAGAKIRT